MRGNDRVRDHVPFRRRHRSLAPNTLLRRKVKKLSPPRGATRRSTKDHESRACSLPRSCPLPRWLLIFPNWTPFRYSRRSFASNIREVPDNQEVYLDADGYTSVIVDILEYVAAGVASQVDDEDEMALRTHLEDVVEDVQECVVHDSTRPTMGKLPYVSIECLRRRRREDRLHSTRICSSLRQTHRY